MHLKKLILFPLLFITSFTADCNLLNLEKEKNNDLVMLLGAYALLANNCTNGAGIWARDLTTNSSVCVTVDLVVSGTNVEVYKERSLSLNYDLTKFGRDFDSITFPKLISTFGVPSDIDGNGKVKILVMDIRDGATANSAYVAGYFDPINYFPDNILSRLRSNYAEVLYLDGKELIAALNFDTNAFASTAAHEFQHLLRYPRMRAANQSDELWINEGTSEVASDIAGYGPQNSRMDCYSGVNDSRCSDGINGVSLLDWDNTSNDVLKQYSFAYVYMRYLYDISGTNDTQRQNFFKETVIGESGTRANSTGNLINLFRNTTYAPNFDASLLGNQNSDVFFRTFALLSAQSFQIANLTSVEQVTSDGASPTTINLATALTRYPLSTTLSRIVTNPVTPTTARSTIKQGSSNFYNSSTPFISASSSRKNYGRVTTATTKGIFFWADSPSGLNANVKYVQTNEEGTTPTIPKQPRSLKSVIESSTGSIPICGIEFIDDGVRTFESIPIE
ncbi:peptidase MA family protein [Leptospira kanakyensis]|uniref:peptidase MA family protein n=1 Tax=Leptospira kanakyensis TaxID=2484968 RepID=UPI00223D642C|nr:peptidase MA family protein [Leptospira kanakyensis]MCW7470804.1 peptidase MA family protein [Leptospira kanakyensis]MCW7483008.1 peptidase MA family protein [Leptospira kanakyensis]